ncbi:hypothetical protein ACFE04_020889 [Oxalis oulophora]
MLQRAASNAYSWWWASHIRTKQSKWLEQNLQDMEEKVASTLKLITEDGDSFAKRAEMYYKKRPELIFFVEESFRAYRALAERYDHLSTELQNANNTIASVCPERVPYSMDDDADDAPPRPGKRPVEISKTNGPQVPSAPIKDLKRLITSAANKKKNQPKKLAYKPVYAKDPPKSGMEKTEALGEIDKLQKHILTLQTEKEFVKSSYESGLAKYWEIEKKITEQQEKICGLQDEFGEGMVIEDDEARTLMAATALKSCQEALAQLQEKQQRSVEEAKVGKFRIKQLIELFEALSLKFLQGDEIPGPKKKPGKVVTILKSSDQEVSDDDAHEKELAMLKEKIKEHFEVGPLASFTVSELAEKIDEIVGKVIGLEAAVASQSALIHRMNTETDDVQDQIRILEDDKETSNHGKNSLTDKLREMEIRLKELQDLNKSVEDQNYELHIHFTEASCNLDHLSKKLKEVRPDDEHDGNGGPQMEDGSCSPNEKKLEKEIKESGDSQIINNVLDDPQRFKPDQELDGKSGPQMKVASCSLHEEKSEKEIEKAKDSVILDNDIDKLQRLKADEIEDTSPAPKEQKSVNEVQKQEEKLNVPDIIENNSDVKAEEVEGKLNVPDIIENNSDVKAEEVEGVKKHNLSDFDRSQEYFRQSPAKRKSDKVLEKEVSSPTLASLLNIEPDQEDEPDWKQLYMNGMEEREKKLVSEYTVVLRSYKEMRKKLTDADTKTRDFDFDTAVQIRELKSAIAMKDEEIRLLRQKLKLMHQGSGDSKSFRVSDKQQNGAIEETFEKSTETKSSTDETIDKEVDIRYVIMGQNENISASETKFRAHIDELLEENLEFWLRFSTSFSQIQKFDTEIQDLQADLVKIEEKQKRFDGNSSASAKYSLKSDARPLYKHLKEIHSELSEWMEKNTSLKEELQSRFTSLCEIQEDITMALKESAEDDEFKFTTFQAAKFQGEVLNMKQENNKVADELQAGLDHITTLQLEVEKTLAKMNEELNMSGSKARSSSPLEHSESRNRIPLRSFIFGVKPKKQKTSFFACVHPALQKKYYGLRFKKS